MASEKPSAAALPRVEMNCILGKRPVLLLACSRKHALGLAGNLIKQAAKGKFCGLRPVAHAVAYIGVMEQRLDTRTYLCYARSDGDGWEGLCIDLDIGVQGANLNEVVDALNEAVVSYVEDAKKEDPVTAQKLRRFIPSGAIG